MDYQSYYEALREEQQEREDREWAYENGLDPDGPQQPGVEPYETEEERR